MNGNVYSYDAQNCTLTMTSYGTDTIGYECGITADEDVTFTGTTGTLTTGLVCDATCRSCGTETCTVSF